MALIPLALRGVGYKAMSNADEALLRRNLLLYGFGGLIAQFIGIKLIDMIITAFIWPEGLPYASSSDHCLVRYMLITTVIFGLIYLLVVTALAQVLFHDKAVMVSFSIGNGELIGSRIIGQPLHGGEVLSFAAHRRQGTGYDVYATRAVRTTLGTNKKLIDRVSRLTLPRCRWIIRRRMFHGRPW